MMNKENQISAQRTSMCCLKSYKLLITSPGDFSFFFNNNYLNGIVRQLGSLTISSSVSKTFIDYVRAEESFRFNIFLTISRP